MSWLNQLNGNPTDWLLEESDPGVKYLALRDLLDRPSDDPGLISARKSAYQNGQIAKVLEKMEPTGYWVKPGPGYGPKYKSTVWAINLLAQLGASIYLDERIQVACDYLLDHSLAEGGQFSYNGAPSGTIDCLQGNLAWALLELGCEDSRLDSAFEWMARTVTGEGIAPASDKKAPIRYYVYKCGPTFACGANNKLPCAWGGVKVMRAFGRIPIERRNSLIDSAIRQGVDFFFSIDPVTGEYPHGNTDKPNRDWWLFGFPVFYVSDILEIADFLTRLGLGNDPRLGNTIRYILEKQDENGRWSLDYDYTSKSYGYYGKKQQPNKWVTLRALRVIKTIFSD